MRLDPLLRAHAYMKVERPLELWEAETDDTSLRALIDDAIAAILASGAPLHELTLNASNVVVESSDDDDERMVPEPAEYVGITLRAPTDLGPDDTWHPAASGRQGLLLQLRGRLEMAGARFAYVRRLPPGGSLTVFFARLNPFPKPDFTGTWTWVPARSRLEIPPPDATVFVITHQDPLFRFSRTHVVGDRRDTFSLDLTTDGKPIDMTQSGLQLRGRVFWEGETLVFDTRLVRAGEEATNVVRYTLSADRQTLAADERFRSRSLTYDNVWVFERAVP